MRLLWIFSLGITLCAADSAQRVEGFAAEVYSPFAERRTAHADFRGRATGSMTAAWWAKGKEGENYVAWKTAPPPRRQETEFVFIGSSAVTPPEFSRGPRARLFVNEQRALDFDLGITLDRTWEENGYRLRFEARRAEWPYAAAQRQFELNGQSGLYTLRVPAAAIRAGEPVTLKVEMLPFPSWRNGWFMVKHRTDALASESVPALAEQVQQLQRDVARLQQVAHVLAANQYTNLLSSRTFEHSLVYTNGYRHVSPADILRLRNGDLLLTAREGTEHVSRDGDVILLRSRDGGRTWGEKQVIAGDPDRDEREACGVELRDGTIVMGVFYNNLYREDGHYEWEWSRKIAFSREKRHLGTFIITSKDQGRTWSAPRELDTSRMPFTDTEGPADAPVEMPDGRIVMPLMAYNVRGDMRNRAAVLVESSDQGQTWQYLSTMADDPGGAQGHFMEPALTLTRSGRLIAAIRNQGPAQALWTTVSDDGGRTWRPPQPSPMIGHPADLIQLADGRILCTYSVRSGYHADPGGIRAAFSHDHGDTWRVDEGVQLRRDFLNLDIGYPESLQMADGRVMTVYYFNLFGRFFLGQTVWKP
jgi:hypothetical protein